MPAERLLTSTSLAEKGVTVFDTLD